LHHEPDTKDLAALLEQRTSSEEEARGTGMQLREWALADMGKKLLRHGAGFGVL